MAITVPVISQFNAKGIEQAKKEFAKLETPAQKAGFAIKKAFAPAAVALGGVVAAGLDFARVAMEDQKSAERLAGQLRRNTDITDDGVKAIEKYVSAMEMQHAVADTDLRESLGRLVTVTKDVSEAQKLMGIALDISAATGKPLEAVTEALAKAHGGQLTALQKLDPSLRDVIKESDSLDQVQQRLIDTFGGASEEMADTAEGKMKKMELAMDNAREAIGYLVLPIIEKLAPALQRLAEFVQDNSRLIGILGAVVGGVAGTIVALNIAIKTAGIVIKVATGIMKLFNIVMAMNPIMLVVIVIGLLIAAVIIAYKRFETFRNIVDTVFQAFRAIVEKAVQFAIGWFERLWDTVKGFIDIIRGVFTGDLKLVMDGFKTVIGNALKNVIDVFIKLPMNILNAIAGPLVNLGKDIVGKIVDGIKNVAGSIGGAIMGAIPGAGAIGGAVSKVRGILPFAEGGIVTRPVMGLVGEAGPEAVIPLDKAGMLGGGITINVAGSVIEERDLVERIRVGLVQAQRNGQRVA